MSPPPDPSAPHPSLLEGAVNSLPPDLVQPYHKDTPGSSGDGGGAGGGASTLSLAPDTSDIGNLLDLSSTFPSSVGSLEQGNPLGLPPFSDGSALGSFNLPPPVSSGEFDLIASGLNDLRPASADAQEGQEAKMAEQQRPPSSLERRPDCVPDTLPEAAGVGEPEAQDSSPSAPQLPSFDSLHPSAPSEVPSEHITAFHSPFPTDADHRQGNAPFAPNEDPSLPPGLPQYAGGPAHYTGQGNHPHPDVAGPAMQLNDRGAHQLPPYGGPLSSGRLSPASVHSDSTHDSTSLPQPRDVYLQHTPVDTSQDMPQGRSTPTGPSQGGQPPTDIGPSVIPPSGVVQAQLYDTRPQPPTEATSATQPPVAEADVPAARPLPQYTLPPSATDKERDTVPLSRPEAPLYDPTSSDSKDQEADDRSSGPLRPTVPHDSTSFNQGLLPAASVAITATGPEPLVTNSMSPPTFHRHGNSESAPNPYVQETLVKQRREAEKHVAEMEEQRRQIAALQRQLSQQAKDKAESASNYQSILSLLQQQQPMVQQQQTFINQLQEQNEMLRKKVHEQQMQYEQRLSQEQLMRDRLQQKIVLVHEEGSKKQKELTEQLEKLQAQSTEVQKTLNDQVKELTEKLTASEQNLAQRARDYQQLQMQVQASMAQAHQAQQYTQQCQSELQEKGRTIEGLQVQQQQHFAAQQQWNVKEQKYKQELVQLQDSLEELKTGDRRHKEEIRQLKQQIQDLLTQLKGSTLPAEDASRSVAGSGTQEGSHHRPTPPPTPSPAQVAPRPETPHQKPPSGDLQGQTTNLTPAPSHTSLASIDSQGHPHGQSPHNPALPPNQQSMMLQQQQQQQLMMLRPGAPQVQMMQPQPMSLTPAQLQILRAQQLRMQQPQPGPLPGTQLPTAHQPGTQPSMQLRGFQPVSMPTQPTHHQPLPQNPLDGSMPSTLALGKPLIPTPHSLPAQSVASTTAQPHTAVTMQTPLYVGPKPVMTPQVVQTPGPGSLHGSPQFSTSGAIPPNVHLRATTPMGSQGSWASVPGQQFFGGQTLQSVPQAVGPMVPTSAITGQHILEQPGAGSRPQFGLHRGGQ